MKKSFCLTALFFLCFYFVILYFTKVVENKAVIAKEAATVEGRPYDPSNDLPYKVATFVKYSGYEGQSPALFVLRNTEGFYRVQNLLSPLLGGGKFEERVMDVPHLIQTVKPDFSKETIFFVFAGKHMISTDSVLMDVVRVKKIKGLMPRDYVEVAVHAQYHQPKASTANMSPMLVFRVANKDLSGFSDFKLKITESYSYEKPGVFAGQAVEDEILVKFKPNVTREQMDSINHKFLTVAAKDDFLNGEWRLLKITDGTPVEIMVQNYLDLPEVEFAEPNFILKIDLRP